MPRIDISKKTLDFAVRNQRRHLFHVKVDNSLTGLKQFQKECLASNIDLSQCLICCEHTGIYSQNILALALENNLSLWLDRVAGAIFFAHQAIIRLTTR